MEGFAEVLIHTGDYPDYLVLPICTHSHAGAAQLHLAFTTYCILVLSIETIPFQWFVLQTMYVVGTLP